jgi:NAD(P)H-dependent FMN reductase
MTTTPRVLAFSGSLRAGSFNHKIVEVAATGARAAGAEVTVIRLRDFALPIFDEDGEAKGTPDSVRKLKDVFRAHQGLLIASPEYNSSMTAALKNALDWVSRPEEGQAPLSCYTGKVAGLLAASPGALGGLRGLVHLRAMLGNIQVLVLPDQFALSKAHEAFGADGSMVDAKARAIVEGIGAKVARTIAKLYA